MKMCYCALNSQCKKGMQTELFMKILVRLPAFSN